MTNRLNTRRKKVLEILAHVPISSTQQLAYDTGVSAETMRKDLDALADEGRIVKVHGGVALANGINEIPFDLRAVKNAEEKCKLARAAIEFVEQNDSIILESCTTNLELSKSLTANPELLGSLTVITNSFPIATVFEYGQKCKQFFFLGGWVNSGQYSTQGRYTVNTLADFHAGKAFISGAALTKDYLLTGYYDDDVSFQKAAINASTKTILMADSSKFGQTAIYSVARLSELDMLITDKKLSLDEKEALKQLGIQIVLA